LIEILAWDPDSEARWHAALAVGRLGEPARSVPALIKAIADPDSVVQRAAGESLSHLGPRAKAALPALTAALDSPNFRVREAVKAALQKIPSD